MNIIFLTHMYPNQYSPYSGIFVEEQVKALRQKIDGKIYVISPVPWAPRILWFRKKWKEYGKIEKERSNDGIKVYYPRYLVFPAGFFIGLEGFFMYLAVRPLIRQLIRNCFGETILHAHTILPDGLAGVLLKRDRNIPLVTTIHGSDINLYHFKSTLSKIMTKFALRESDYVATVSSALKDKVLKIAKRMPYLSVIYNGADPQKFRQMPKGLAMEKLGLRGLNQLILYVGNLVPVKGVKYLISAYARLRKEGVSLYLIGDGLEKENLCKFVKLSDIQDKVHFLGKRPHEELPYWLNAADIFVLPSLSEGFPTIIPEAMMCNLPVIATEVGGIKEIVIDSRTGILVDPGDIEGLTKALDKYLGDDDFRRKVVVNAGRIAKNFTWCANADRYKTIYQELLGKNGKN